MWCLTETPAHNEVTLLPHGILVAGQFAISLLLDRLKHPSSVGADRSFPPSVQAATLPFWARQSLRQRPWHLNSLEGPPSGSATTWTNEIQDRRNVMLGE